MLRQPKRLNRIFIAILLLPACGSSGGADESGGGGGGASATGGTTSATGGTTSAAGGTTAGASTDTGGAAGSGGSSVIGGTAGSSSGGSAAGGSNSGGAAGGSAGAGMGGTNAGGGAGGARTFAKPEGSVPSQYAGTPTNKGQWTSTTYPAFYHGSGSVGQVIAKQGTSITKPVNVYTPPGYDAQNKYPLVFFLHGYPDNQDTWRQRAKIKPDVLLDNLINAKVIKPIIGVWPMGSSTGNSNDTGGYMVFDNELFGDLIPFLESKYSIAAGRDSRAMSGFSYGGMQTINVFLCHHLKDFGWFAGYSPAGGNYGSDMIASCLKQQDPKTYPVNYFYIQTGSNELATSSAAASANGLTTKAAPTITSANFTYLVTNGGHDYDNDTIGLYNFVRIAFPY
jgi:enterochelin esterase-like enzyme